MNTKPPELIAVSTPISPRAMTPRLAASSLLTLRGTIGERESMVRAGPTMPWTARLRSRVEGVADAEIQRPPSAPLPVGRAV